MTELRRRYFHALGLYPRGESAKPRLEAALARAYQQRSFEIEHYWKRATYFWAFEVAIFAALGFLWKAPSTGESNPVTVALASLGLLTAVANSISARGSKFWQENWENHIDMLEDAIEGRLHKTVWLRGGRVSFSVSRVNETLSCCFVVFWTLVALYVAWRFLGSPPFYLPADNVLRIVYVSITALFVVIGLLRLLWQRTRFSGILIESHGNSTWPPSRWWRISRSRKPPAFVRRHAPDEDQ